MNSVEDTFGDFIVFVRLIVLRASLRLLRDFPVGLARSGGPAGNPSNLEPERRRAHTVHQELPAKLENLTRERAEGERTVEIPGAVREVRVGDIETERGRSRVRGIAAASEGHEGLLDGAMADDLPRAVEREDDGLVENIGVHGKRKLSVD